MSIYDTIDPGPLPQTPLVPIYSDAETGGDDHADTDTHDDGFVFPDADLTGSTIPDPDTFLKPRITTFSMAATTSEQVMILRALGWRVRTSGELRQVIGLFQQAWLLGPALTVDKIPGPKTSAAMRLSYARHLKNLPTASTHFSFVEYQCKCGGKYANCPRIWTKRAPISEDEQYRQALGHGVQIVSGCRCPGHNNDVQGAPRSRHMVGDARDFPPEQTPEWFVARGIYRGHGYNASNHLVRHGDMGPKRSWIYS